MRKDRKHSRGITLLEVVFAAAILVIILHSAAKTFLVTASAQQEILTRDVLDEEVRRTSEQLANRLRSAGLYTVADVPAAPAVSSKVRFRRSLAFDPEKGHVWGPEESVSLSRGALWLDTGYQRTPLGLHVTGVTFSLAGRDLTIGLWADSRGPGGGQVRVFRRSHVTLRN